MEALLIDIGALAAFLSAMAIVYWRGASPEAKSADHVISARIRDSGTRFTARVRKYEKQPN